MVDEMCYFLERIGIVNVDMVNIVLLLGVGCSQQMSSVRKFEL